MHRLLGYERWESAESVDDGGHFFDSAAHLSNRKEKIRKIHFDEVDFAERSFL